MKLCNVMIQLRANLVSYLVSLFWFRHPHCDLYSDIELQKRGGLYDQTALSFIFNVKYLPRS